VAAQPDFWNDQTTAQRTLQELNDLKAHLEQLDQWQTNLDDARAVLELLELEDDTALLQEAYSNVTQLSQELDQWELQQLLSGTYDQKGAVLTINAGAGGTDAQDWAEMLLRMYFRWAEDHRYKVHEVERSDGDEAGIKSKSTDAMPTATCDQRRVLIAWCEFHRLTRMISAKPALLGSKSCR